MKLPMNPGRRRVALTENERQEQLERLSASLSALDNIGADDAKRIKEFFKQRGLGKAANGPLINQEDRWKIRFQEIKKSGNAKDPVNSGWAYAQKARYHKGTLSPDRIAALESLSWWTWEKKTRTKKSPVY